jgi:hypothetical protein
MCLISIPSKSAPNSLTIRSNALANETWKGAGKGNLPMLYLIAISIALTWLA